MYMLCQCPIRTARFSLFFFFNDTATTEIYTLSLHDALPIFEAVLENTAECPEDGSYCRPNYSVVHYYQQLDSALLEPVAPPEEPVVGPVQPAAPQSFVVPAGKARHCRTVNPRRKAKGTRPKANASRHASAATAKRKPLKLCLSRLARVG